ncbi:DUF3817 domain-containing protein [Demequina sp. SYSU T00192]|uniref:DUF3817 domain-containing protein n=1 Tax=Demequina litoralis TaxID=3051660 RepID=A0ABT8G7U5_9MICO|nr:DUF3817 domain-containing protein [Demequina sp. SYSU T00192]MDN4474999.1 DUF3817 domain-containing protein [Demequina sp. SYSU T00192]
MSEAPSTTQARRIAGALARYRIMAFVTGTLLMIVFVGLIRYIPGLDGLKETLDPILLPIAILHGWVFIVYLAAVTHLWMLMRWGLGRLVYMAAGGVVPLLSFFAERRVHAEVSAQLEEAK